MGRKVLQGAEADERLIIKKPEKVIQLGKRSVERKPF